MLLNEFETKSYRVKQFFSSESGTSFEFEGKENSWQIRLTDYQAPDVSGQCHFIVPSSGEFDMGFYVINKRQTPQPHLDLYVFCPGPHLTQHQSQIEMFFREFFVGMGMFAEDEGLRFIELT